MKTGPNSRNMLYPMAAALTLFVAGQVRAEESFTLGRAVPDNVFLYAAEKYNPERDFIDAHWADVFDALRASGIGNDVLGLISSFLGESERQEMDRLQNLATELIKGVEWGKLDGGESVFAMRFAAPSISETSFSSGPPDMVWLFKGTPGSTAGNFEGLVAILDAIVVEINRAGDGGALRLDRTPLHGADTASLRIGSTDDQMGVWGRLVSVAQKDGVIVIATGNSLFEEVLVRFNDESGSGSIAQSPRFQSAFGRLPKPEDCMVLFDMQQMVQSLRSMISQSLAFAEAQGLSGNMRSRHPLPEAASEFDERSMDAYRTQQYQEALDLVTQAQELAPDHPRLMYNRACFSALTGRREEALTWLERSVDAGFTNANLIASDPDLESLRGDGRYQTALSKARAATPENEMAVTSVVESLTDSVFDAMGTIDYIAEVDYTSGYSTHNESITVLVPNAEEKPFYPIIAGRDPIVDYTKFLPQESVSYSVSSGIDVDALYTYIIDVIKSAGPAGEAVLQRLAAWQAEHGFDIRMDLLSWIQGEMVEVTFMRPSGEAQVSMIRVTDEAKAKESLRRGLEAINELLQGAIKENPMLGMFTMRLMPATDRRLEGFWNVGIGMMPVPMALGVANGYLIIGTSEDAVLTCLATAAGEHPDVTLNSELMAEALVPSGPCSSVSFTDRKRLGATLAGVAGGISMAGTMATMAIPDPEAQRVVAKITAMLGKLSPVLQKIDFFRSTSSVTTFDGQSWYSHSVTHYRSPQDQAQSQTGSAL